MRDRRGCDAAIEVAPRGGPESVAGHLCTPCTEAVEVEGAVGVSARHRALLEHAARTRGDRKAQRLRNLLVADYPPPTPGWGALATRVPNLAAWEHVRHLLDRL